jgi:hypothetical protein
MLIWTETKKHESKHIHLGSALMDLPLSGKRTEVKIIKLTNVNIVTCYAYIAEGFECIAGGLERVPPEISHI